MSAPVIAFLSGRRGVGTSSLVYHLAWMYDDLGARTVVVDADPQADVTAALVDAEDREDIWSENERPETVYDCLRPILGGSTGTARPRHLPLGSSLTLLAGDLLLSQAEDELSRLWPRCLEGDERALCGTSAFSSLVEGLRRIPGTRLILMDLGPTLGAINRSALLAADCIVLPASPDALSVRSLRCVGPCLRRWRDEWRQAKERTPLAPSLPEGAMALAGYIVIWGAVRLDAAANGYEQWIAQTHRRDHPAAVCEDWLSEIPAVYRETVLGEAVREIPNPGDDPHCIGILKHYDSLASVALEARKPVFHLTAADGAVGAHAQAVKSAYQDFRRLAVKIARRAGVELP